MESQENMEQEGSQPVSARGSEIGAALRAARERMGMSVDEVAGRLKFARRQITALENGELDQLPQLAFVRGFVRSYARLVQIDEKPLLDALPGAPAPAAIEVRASAGELPHRGAEWRRQNLFWLGGALAVVVAGIIAWKYDAGEATPKGAQDARSGTTVSTPDATQTGGAAPGTDAAQLSGSTQPGGAAQPAGAAQRGAAAQPGGLAQAPELALGAPGSGGTAPSAEAAQPAGAAHAVDSTRPAAEVRSAEPGAPKAAATGASSSEFHVKPKPAAGAASSVAATGERASRAPRVARLVRLEFAEDSWVEVRDGTGKLLLSMLGKQGTSQNVSGPPPLSVVVGNAKGVKLFYKGEPVALEPMRGSEVARLKLE